MVHPLSFSDPSKTLPAQRLWTLDFFRTRYGHLTLDSAPMTVAQYIDYLESTQDESPDYLSSWDFMLQAPKLPPTSASQPIGRMTGWPS